MAKHELIVHDGSDAEDTAAPTIEHPPPVEYVVVNPLFKRGKEWEPGSLIPLDAQTAASFLAQGDIEEQT